ncbi:Eco57I restriction-modification methylase domain-containing protein [Haloglomus salinum]|uniref:Eco57I restriction-modification methylase domain-containing protein n=1 Tax=Haloglomus salinum TaxID=2962673 RepID=UPI0020C9C832|nr:TaqI-like C-terminal specificity domain-containing protein [Haloglomus salinum]
MQSALTYRTNRDLFSNYYLNEHLPKTEPWNEVPDDEVESAMEDIRDLYQAEADRVEGYNEAQLERELIRPVFERLGITFEIEETVERGQRRPDYAFFRSQESKEAAHERRDEGGDFYEEAIAVADAKRWGRKLDTRGKRERDFENPSYQIHVYLQETPATWAVLTNGQKWRLYYGPTSHRLDSYYEIDLPTLLEEGDTEAFRYFYLFFRRQAFVEESDGDCFLDDVYDESSTFAEALGEDLQDNIYEAIRVLAEGFLEYNDDLGEEDLERIHDSSLIYLYRLIFVLYAESEGRDLLPTDNDIYSDSYSLNDLKRTVADNLEDSQDHYLAWKTDLWNRLGELFDLINEGSQSRGIPEDQLYIPAYNGGLFRTNPDPDDSEEALFLASHEAPDSHLAEVVDLLTRREADEGDGKVFVDYSSLDIRHLGSIYEGLLEYQLNVAHEPKAVEAGEYVSADSDSEVVVNEGDVYLTTDSGERKATGSYYTPEYVVEYIVEETLGPIVDDIRGSLVGQSAFDEGGFAEEFAEEVFDLKILDPAMGSGHFLTSAIDYLAREIIDAQERQAAQQGIETVDEEHDINWARRQVAQRCIYGVDLNPLAVELAKVSLWLRTLAAEQPLAFLDHHLKTGNSLVGSDIETVLDNGDPDNGTEEGQLTLQESFDRTRRQALEHVTNQFEDLLAIDNETLDDIKEMETVYDEVRDDPLYQHLIAMANVHTAERFGLDVPADAYERMAEALRDDSWEKIERYDWYQSAEAMAKDQQFFHWELEFPIAFYEQDGDRQDHGGFDVVLGNPPYGDILDTRAKKYCRAQGMGFESERADIFTAFVALPDRILRAAGTWSYIIPNTPLKGKQYEAFRRVNSQRYSIEEIVDFGEHHVFNEEIFTMILTASNMRPSENYNATLVEGDEAEISDEGYSIPIEARASQPWRVVDRVEGKITELDEIVELEPSICTCHDAGIDYKVSGQGWQNRGEGTKISDLIMYEGEQENEEDHRYVGGGEIERYRIEPENKWLRHDYDSFVEGDIVIQVYPEYTEVSEKLLTRQTAETLIGAIDTNELYTAKSVHTTLLNDERYDLWYVLALINSAVLRYVYRSRSGEEDRTFAQVRIHELRDLPIRAINFDGEPNERSELVAELEEEIREARSVGDVISKIKQREVHDVVLHDLLAILARIRSEETEDKSGLNLALLDYLGIPSDELPQAKAGETLEDLQMPVAGVADTPLTKTTDEYEGLRIEGVSFADEGGRLVLSVSLSYKIDEEDPRETDRWNRLAESEFETYEAMAFVGLSEAEETLLREFVPVAIEEDDGFAGFRQGATKTNSPLDRLKDLTLPDIGEVQTGLEQYIKVRERADDLDEKIEKIDQLINEIVYDLYKLTDEEIEIVESAVRDD